MARILVVDDEPDITHLCRVRFGLMGHEVHVAGDGVEALEVAEREDVDLVLTDLLMPGMDGLRLRRELAERAPDAAVVVWSVAVPPLRGDGVEPKLPLDLDLTRWLATEE